MSAQRRVCPRGTKSLCQKQLVILLSKVRLCGGRPARLDRGPGEWLERGLRAWEVEARGAGGWGPTEGGSPKVGGGLGQDDTARARSCLSFPSLWPITPSLLAVEAKGKASGARSGAPKPRSSGSAPHCSPPTQESPPPPSAAYVPALAILSIPSGGAGGGGGCSGRLGHPEGFCSSGSPAPAPAPPLLHALAAFPLAERAWRGANLPSSPPGVLAATSPARPSVRPPP